MNNQHFQELTILEKTEFIGKLVIAAQTDYFDECTRVVNIAQCRGLYEQIKPLLSESLPELIDLANPIENGIVSH